MKRKRRKSNIQKKKKKTKTNNPELELIELSPFVKDFEILGH